MSYKLKNIYTLLLLLLILAACNKKKDQPIVTPWGEVQSDTISTESGFSISDIVNNGELIILTISGPDTYYEYHGRSLGTQYLMCEKFAQKLGVSLRVEVCKDTLEMISRLDAGDADLLACMLPRRLGKSANLRFCGAKTDSIDVQWAVRSDNTELADSLNSWYKPQIYAEVLKESRSLLSSQRVKRHVYSPFLNKSGGVISHYDHLFKKYSPVARWDWRLLAAQCYQESCFDPRARSWAGASGLMQIMPSTAAHLGLPASSIYDPEANVHAAVRYINELSGLFRNIPDKSERQLFVLASYNGGYFHIQDAMSLARKNGRNPHRWRDVARYVLLLEHPEGYNDPVVKNGYMRGSETVDYVDKIRMRYAQYRGVPYGGASVDGPVGTGSSSSPVYSPYIPHKAKKKHRFHI